MQRLVLVGGGPNHYEIIKSAAAGGAGHRQVVLVSPSRRVFDEQHLPRYLLKLLTRQQCELDLWKACQRAGVEFVADQVILLDKENHLLELENSGQLVFDTLSVECSSESVYPRMNSGSQSYILPSKPHDLFVSRFQDFVTEVRKHSPMEVRVAMSGSRFAVVELALAIQQLLRKICKRSEIVILSETNDFLFDIHQSQRKPIIKILEKRGIRLLKGKLLERIDQHVLFFTDGSQIEMDIFVPAENFRPQSLFTRLLCAQNQRLYVNSSLQYEKDERVFIHGDCVRLFVGQEEYLLTDKAEQVRVLQHNLFRTSAVQPLAKYRIRSQRLSELPVGEQKSIRFWGPFASQKTWDRAQWLRDMSRELAGRQFVELNHANDSLAIQLENFEAGHARRPWEGQRQLTGSESGRLQLVSSLGYNWWGDYRTSARYLTELVLAKSLCQGLIPESMRMSLVIPDGDPNWSQFLFQSSIKAVEQTVHREGVYFAGGDTLSGKHWSLALTIAGQQMTQSRRRFASDDYLLITRPLGFGLLWSGRRQEQFASQWFEKAVTYPVCPGIAPLVQFFEDFDITAAVAIEEWGFLYHCMQAVPVDQQLVVNFREIPKWTGIDELMCENLEVPSIDSNWNRIAKDVNFRRDRVAKSNSILWDSRSHGAIVLGVKKNKWQQALARLVKMGFTEATVIGCIRPKKSDKKVVLSDWVAQDL